jgi:hypothetical protein
MSIKYYPISPHRLPDTITIEERLPEGSAAVLINQAHTDTDIYLPINADEKQLVDAIDGSQTIKQISEGVRTIHPGKLCLEIEQIHDLFIRLWRFDQVVFETSRT